MNPFTFFLLPAILFIGIITSYQDFKFGKIKNKWVLFGLFYFITFHVLLALFGFPVVISNSSYWVFLGVNVLFAFFIGFGFWLIRLWAAGDGKLFLVYSVLIPLSAYSFNFNNLFPSLDILINTFVIAFIFIFFSMFFQISFQTLKKITLFSIKKSFEPKQLLLRIINLFVLFWVVELFLSLIHLQSNILKIALPMALFVLIPKKYENKMKWVFAGFLILRLVIDDSIYSWGFLTNFLLLLLVALLFRGFLEHEAKALAEELFNEKIKINQLKPGMILGVSIIKKDKKELPLLRKAKIEIVKYKGNYYVQQTKSFLSSNPFLGEEPEGLTREQIKLIKQMGFKKIIIGKTISFALFMFIGVLITLIIKGNFISFFGNIL
jgi:hypothetical protein